MTLEYQLRDYLVKPGKMDDWIAEWTSKILPLRLRFGFNVVGAWQLGGNRFVWVLGYDGKKGDFRKADERYYASKERARLKPDPARHLSRTSHWMMTNVIAAPEKPHKAVGK